MSGTKRDYETMILDHMSSTATRYPLEKKRFTLEFFPSEGDRYSFPLINRSSNIYKEKEVFSIESYRALRDTHKQVTEWFKNNSLVTNDEQFQNIEKGYLEDICTNEVRSGYLILYFGKKTYSRVDVNIYDNIVRFAKLDDQKAINESLIRIFEQLVPEFKENADLALGNIAYKDMLNLWRSDEDAHIDSLEPHNFFDELYHNQEMLENSMVSEELKKLKTFEKNMNQESQQINREIVKANKSLQGKNSELFQMNKDLVKKCKDLDQIRDLKVQIEEKDKLLEQKNDLIVKLEKEVNDLKENLTKEDIEKKGLKEDIDRLREFNEKKTKELNDNKKEFEKYKTENILRIKKDNANWSGSPFNKAPILRIKNENEKVSPTNVSTNQNTNGFHPAPFPDNSESNNLKDKSAELSILYADHDPNTLEIAEQECTLSKDELKKNIQTINKELESLKGIIIAQKELDLTTCNLEIKNPGEMVTVLHQKFNEREKFIKTINGLNEKLCNVEEEILLDTQNQISSLQNWNKVVQEASEGCKSAQNEYNESVRDERSPDWKMRMKELILKEGNCSTHGIKPPNLKWLESLNFDVKKVENEDFSFKLKAWGNHNYDLTYSGYLVDGQKEGNGKLTNKQGKTFYEGHFRNGEIYGSKIQLFYEKDKLLLDLKTISNESEPLNSANGKVILKHSNGQTAYNGNQLNGLKSGESKEFYDNGNLRYSGNFFEGEYHSDVAVIYNSYPEQNKFIDGAKINKGKLEGNVQLWYNYNDNSNNGYPVINDGEFTNGKLDHTAKSSEDPQFANKDTLKADETHHFDGIFDCYYEGCYKEGMKHGSGKIYCQSTNKVIFEGEWRDNIPYKNKGGNSDLITFYHRTGIKIFEGTIKKAEDGWFEGNCTLYIYDDTNAILYRGNYRAPTLSTIMFVHWEMELQDHQPFIKNF